MKSRPGLTQRELGGPDPLDRRLGTRPLSALDWLRSLFLTRSALGLAPSLTPAIVFLPLGIALGPHGLQWLTPRVREGLDAAVTITLASLGVLVGIALGREIRTARRLLIAGSLESAATIAIVTAAVWYFVTQTQVPLAAPIAAMALALGLSASASSATSASPDSEAAAAIGNEVADVDDVLPIVAAVAAFALLPSPGDKPVWVPVLAPIGVGLAIGAIGWLVFDRAESAAERVVFVLGAVALAGGAASALGASPLAAGLVAGLIWTAPPGRAARIARQDIGRVQHSLVVLLLVSAGAEWTPSMVALWLLAPYLLFRLVGKIVGALVTAAFLEVRAADLAAFLMPPGVLAIAFALNFRQLLPEGAGGVLVSTVAMGTAAFELFAVAVLPRWRRGSR